MNVIHMTMISNVKFTTLIRSSSVFPANVLLMEAKATVPLSLEHLNTLRV